MERSTLEVVSKKQAVVLQLYAFRGAEGAGLSHLHRLMMPALWGRQLLLTRRLPRWEGAPWIALFLAEPHELPSGSMPPTASLGLVGSGSTGGSVLHTIRRRWRSMEVESDLLEVVVVAVVVVKA